MTMTISGDGTIGGLVAGGLPNATIQQADLAANVAGNGPAFSAYPSSAQTLSSNTQTKLLYGTEEYDTNNNFSASRFTPSVAGYYFVQATMQAGVSWTGGSVYIYKNGAAYKTDSEINSTAGDTGTFSASCLVYCNGTTDYIEAYGGLGVGQTLTTSQTNMWFQGYMVRAA